MESNLSQFYILLPVIRIITPKWSEIKVTLEVSRLSTINQEV